jgi:multidrug resistance efflux pump
MPVIESKSRPETTEADREIAVSPDLVARAPERRWRILPLLLTFAAVALAVGLGWMMWDAYVVAPWTRDGTVRTYVVTMAPEVSGRIIALPVADTQFVHKGQILMVIDPTDFAINVRLREAAAQQALATMQNAERENRRRQALPNSAVTVEEQQTFKTQAVTAQAQYEQALANLDQARVNLRRTVIRSPVNGWVTNLLTQRGDFATAGQAQISVVNADTFWVDGYFEETSLGRIQIGDAAKIKLMGHSQTLTGHVENITRAINVANAQPNGQGVATVNPIFTWVRLAQRIPVRIRIDHVPQGVVLSAGMTATVEIEPRPPGPAK